MKTDRPIALREAIMSCKNGGTVSIVGVYGGFIDKPIGAVMNRSLRIMTGQCHVQRYTKKLLGMIQRVTSIRASSSPTTCVSRMRRRHSTCSCTSATIVRRWF